MVIIVAWLYAAVAGCASGTTAPPAVSSAPRQGTSRISFPTTPIAGISEQLPAMLFTPAGPGPFPAIVIMHDCSGLGPRSSGAPGRWAELLVAEGYVVFMPDSFTTRGHADGVCTFAGATRNDVSPIRRASDARAAFAYVRTLPYVDGRRVGLMGGSHGGSTTLNAMAGGDRGGFGAAVALYPACAPFLNVLGRPYAPVGPVLILMGDADDWTPAEPCQKLATAARAAGHPVDIKVYPGAHHSFDSRNPVRYVATRMNRNSPTGRGATTGGDPDAWADSIRCVKTFFAERLKSP